MEQLNSDTAIDNKNLPKIQVASHFSRNGRRRLEDRFVVENNLNAIADLPHKYRYYAIFDGHVNEQAAEYCKNKLHLNLIENENFKNGDISLALKETFMQTDKDFCDLSQNSSAKAGTTALVCLIENDKRVFIAWAGDTTSILIRNGQPELLTREHTPKYEDERERINKLGGECIYFDYNNMWRVMGILGVSRSIGDVEYKPFVTAEPDIVEFELNGTQDFLVMASDGLWDTLTLEDATTIVYEILALNANEDSDKVLNEIPRILTQRSIEDGSSDNITTIVVFLKDLAEISPPLIKENGRQNGYHHNEIKNENIENNENEFIFKNGHVNNDDRTLESPIDLLHESNNLIKTEPEEINYLENKNELINEDNLINNKENCNELNNDFEINVTSNEDNAFDENLSAINTLNANNSFTEDADEPHSILPEINDQFNEHQPQQTLDQVTENTIKSNDNLVINDDFDEEVQRELDEERVVRTHEEEDKNIIIEEDKDVIEEEKNIELEENKIDLAEEKNIDLEEKEKKIDLEGEEQQQNKKQENSEDVANTINCEYSVIPDKSEASPVFLSTPESTNDDLIDTNKINEVESLNENLQDNLATSPFEHLNEEENQPELISKNESENNEIESNVVIKIENEEQNEILDDTLQNDNQLEIVLDNSVNDESSKSEENSFEFIEKQDTVNSSNEQNNTYYQSPENSNISKLIGAQEEVSVYENANTSFENSIANNNENLIKQEQLEITDDYKNEDENENENEIPFENDSENSIKYIENKDTPIENETDDLINSTSKANLKENETFNLMLNDSKFTEELNKNNLPETIEQKN